MNPIDETKFRRFWSRHRSRTRKSTLLAGWLAAMFSGQTPVAGAAWKEWELSGFAEVEVRVFPEAPADSRQFRHFDASVALEPEIYRQWEASQVSLTVTPFVRLDLQDSERTHVDLREFLVRKGAGRWEVRAGVGKVFWGVTESRHLVDVINQTDLVGNIDEEDKLGQPMINLAWLSESAGAFQLFYLPYFRERTFAGVEGRLRGPLVVREDDARYESDLEQWHPDLAARWSHVLGEFDLGIHYFYGTSRVPLFDALRTRSGETVLKPVYNLMHQAGLDAQWTHESWLIKFEGIVREGKGQHFQALSSGFEYTLYGVRDSALDVGLLGELHYDSRGDDALTLFNHDLFFGGRLTFNDTQDTALLLGALFDYENGTTSVRAEFERRLGSHYTLAMEGQWFANADEGDPAHGFRRDSFVQVGLRRYF